MSSDIETADGELPSAGSTRPPRDPRFRCCGHPRAVGSPRPRPEDEPGVGAAAGAAASRRSCMDVEGSAGGRACARRGDRGAAGSGCCWPRSSPKASGRRWWGPVSRSAGVRRRGLDLDSLGSSLARAVPAADELVHHRRVDVSPSGHVQAVRLRTRQMADAGIDAAAGVALHQLFVPMADMNWMAVVTATTGLLRLSAAVGDTAAHVAESIRAGDAMG